MSFHDQHPQEIEYSLRREMNEFYWAMAIKNFAVYLGGFFLVVYVYQYFNESLVATFAFYAVEFLLYAVFAPIGARSMQSLGLKKSMAVGNPFLAAYFLCLLFAPQLGFPAIVVALIVKLFYFMFFWPARHVDFARFARRGKQGQHLSVEGVIVALVKAMGPLVGGLILTLYGFPALLIISSLLIAIASFPLFFSPEVYEKYSLTWRESYRYAWHRKNRRASLSFIFQGAESGIRLFVFPLYVFLVIPSFTTIGLITSFTLVIALFFTYYIGWLSDKEGGMKIFSLTSIVHAFSWLINGFITTPMSYLAFSSLFRLSELATELPYMQYFFKQAKQRMYLPVGRTLAHGHGTDEYIVLREIMHSYGRMLAFALVAVMALFGGGFVSFPILFVIAAMCTIAMRVIKG